MAVENKILSFNEKEILIAVHSVGKVMKMRLAIKGRLLTVVPPTKNARTSVTVVTVIDVP